MPNQSSIKKELINALAEYIPNNNQFGWVPRMDELMKVQQEQIAADSINYSVTYTIEDMYKSYVVGMNRGSDVANAVFQQNDKLIEEDDFETFMLKNHNININITTN